MDIFSSWLGTDMFVNFFGTELIETNSINERVVACPYGEVLSALPKAHSVRLNVIGGIFERRKMIGWFVTGVCLL